MVADGYKNTEIGVIPVEWKIIELGSICHTTTGKLNSNAMVENGQYKFFTCAKEPYLIDEYKFDTEALLISGNGANVGYIHYYNGKFNAYQRTYVLDEFTNNIQYIKYILQRLLKDRIDKEKNAGNTPYITLNTITEMKIPLPRLKEQEKIAGILSTADDKIDAITSQIEKAETLKKGLLQKLLSEGIGHIEFKDSELGKIPKSWEVVKLGSCVDGKGNYGIGAAAVNYDKNLPIYLRITDIDENGNFISTNRKCVDSPEALNYKLEDGDIVFARTGNTTGKTYHYNPKDGVLIYAGFLIKFTPNKKLLDTYYLKLQGETSRYWDWVKVTSMRTGQPGINSEEYGKFLLPLPPLEEQKQISKILSTADEKLEVLRAKKEKYETLKKGLLQKLLSG